MLNKSFVIGVDYKSTGVDIRQKLSDLSVDLLAKQIEADELYVLSTCNRYEVYVTAKCTHAKKGLLSDLKGVISSITGIPEYKLSSYVYEKTGKDMLKHGFNVASSLESMVLGEPQILGQMKKAYQNSKEQGKIKSTLDKFFNASFHVGKRVRSETFLSNESVSVASAAIKIAQKKYGKNFNNANIVLIGAGDMCTAAARNLKAKGFSDMTIVNRTLARAKKLALEVGANAVRLPKLMSSLKKADIVICCTGSKEIILSFNMVCDIAKNKENLTLIDLAVPRNIDVNVKDIPNVDYIDMDMLGEYIKISKFKRLNSVANAEKIINEEIEVFDKWNEERKKSHMVKHLRNNFESIRQEVLTKHKSKEADLATNALLNKIMHNPTIMIKSGFIPSDGVEAALKLMFNVQCPRVEFLQIDAASVNKGECPFLDVIRKEGIANIQSH